MSCARKVFCRSLLVMMLKENVLAKLRAFVYTGVRQFSPTMQISNYCHFFGN